MNCRTIGKRMTVVLGLVWMLGVSASQAVDVFSVREYGARGDGEHLDTEPIQEAVEECARAGGGTVYFPAGTYLSGTIMMKSHVTLRLSSGATLLGSTSLEHYPEKVADYHSYTENYVSRSLIYGEDLEDVSIVGNGTIDGQGGAFAERFGSEYRKRPYIVRFVTCRDVLVENITLRNSPMWVQHYLGCCGVTIRGVTVRSRVAANNDGININSCRRVRISDADIYSGDDAIAIKSSSARPTENVVVTNCVLSSNCNGFKLGTESNGGFRNITVSNLVIYDTRLSGIALEEVDGGTLEQVNISNVVMDNVGNALFLRLGNRARPYPGQEEPGMGRMRNVMISDVQAINVGSTGGSITGQPGQPMENVTLDNIRVVYGGGGSRKDGIQSVPTRPRAYPEFSMFGKLPGYGLYVRHVENLTLRNVEVGFIKEDMRPAFVLRDVRDARFLNVRAERAPRGLPSIVSRGDVRGLSVFASPGISAPGGAQ